jgi:probable HAF family extracellular repeat protein
MSGQTVFSTPLLKTPFQDIRILTRGVRTMKLSSLVLALGAFFSIGPFVYGDVAYTVADLGTFGARDVNNKGQVVGYSYVSGAGWHVFLSSAGTTTDLGILTGAFSQAGSINDSGVIAGWGDTLGQNHEFAFTYDGGTVTPINVSGANYSYAYDINNSGLVVGKADLSGSQSVGFLYEDGSVTKFDTFGWTSSTAASVNNQGKIVGYSSDADSNQHVFLYDKGNVTYLESLSGTNCYPECINDNSLVVGYTYAPAYASCIAFLYDNGTVTQLGVLQEGDKYIKANFINNLDQIVGESSASLTGTGHAFIYENDSMTDLNNLIDVDSGWVLTSASSINDYGQIVGNGLLNGVYHAYLLTPVPEPSALALIGIAGIISFVTRRSFRRRAVGAKGV